MTFERVKWSLLLLWIGVLSVAMIIVTDAHVGAIALVLAFWVVVFIRYWPEEGESA